ncbi:hypothetical protein N566_02770 [Streptomycetaceae bacterium MP113-05]|nr:hypothetical protein N566_02770 [Streptomycetaceae bacterium MP113-05]
MAALSTSARTSIWSAMPGIWPAIQSWIALIRSGERKAAPIAAATASIGNSARKLLNVTAAASRVQ